MKKSDSFEESIKKLENIVSILESGNESLEESLKLFSEGTKIAGKCYNILNTAEQKINDLSNDCENGEDNESNNM